MHYVAIVTVLALAQYFLFGALVARARVRYGVQAPASSGHEIFERHFRVQMNTLEQLIIFLPLLWIFAHYVSPLWAAVGGVLFIVGRAVYARSYVRNPKSRSLGFALTAIPSFTFMFAILWNAIRAIALGV
ncbi:MAG TPA: MAPEG family protein [Povalibacter sp.]|jgi:uncharacterized membrane protein YecN with MAPEG domain|nr:MAPEG family protein [Povalibacter sp.]